MIVELFRKVPARDENSGHVFRSIAADVRFALVMSDSTVGDGALRMDHAGILAYSPLVVGRPCEQSGLAVPASASPAES